LSQYISISSHGELNVQWFGLVYSVYRHFQQYISSIVAVSFIGAGNQRKPQTCRKSLTNFITSCCIEHTPPWTGFELIMLVVMGTDCTGSCKSNYHTITTTTAPIFNEILFHWHYHDWTWLLCVQNWNLHNTRMHFQCWFFSRCF
jgi:hypothetical protein